MRAIKSREIKAMAREYVKSTNNGVPEKFVYRFLKKEYKRKKRIEL